MSEAAPASDKSITPQRLLQWVTASGAAAAALGFGALYLQFERYGIPASLITVEQAGRAGLLPMAALIVVLGYAQLAMRVGQIGVVAAIALPYVPLLAIIMISALGMVALAAVIAGDIVAPIVWATLGWPEPGGRVRMVVGLAIVALGAAIPIVGNRRRPARGQAVPSATGEPAEVAPRAGPVAPAFTWRSASVMIVGAGLYIWLGLTGLKAGLDDLALGWSLQDLSGDLILDLALAGAGLALLTVGWIWMSDWASPSLQTVLRAGQAAVLFVLVLGYYSVRLYPRLSPGLGGGRVEHMTLWLEGHHTPPMLRNAFAAPCIVEDELVRCDDVPTLAVGEKVLVLLPRSGPAIVLLRDVAKAVRPNAP